MAMATLMTEELYQF